MNEDTLTSREKIWYIINTIQANQLFVHSKSLVVSYATDELVDTLKKNEKKNKIIQKYLPEILTTCILNSIVPNSAMLLVGGHGGGKTSIVKYLGRMLTGISLDEAEECILRAHPQLTEEKIIATLNIGKLMNKGVEEVIWRKFSTSFWKIIDEVNRCSPYTQNILLSLLAEGKIKYYDSVQNISKYCLYATLNPNDVGTFEMSPPFLDRFGISVPISMPQTQDLSVILGNRDDKLGSYDELTEVPAILTEEELLNIWYDVSNVPCSKEAEDYIHAIIREYTLCIRIDKGNSDYLKPSTGLCSGCHFDIPDKIPCNCCDSILSVRAAKDLLRYAKALTWILGLKQVNINGVMTVAPYVLSHRTKYVERRINKTPFWGSKYLFTEHILDMVLKRYNTRKKAYDILSEFRIGNAVKEDIKVLKAMAKNDLIVKLDLLPLAQKMNDKKYQKMIQEIEKANQNKKVKELTKFRKDLLIEMDFPNRGDLISRINNYLRTLTLKTYNCSMLVWNSIRFTIDGFFPQFTSKLKETTKRRGTYRLRNEDIELEINITGIKDYDYVNFNFYGGDIADRLQKAIEKNHKNELKSMEELIDESNKAKEKEFEGKIMSVPHNYDDYSDDDLFDDELLEE